MSPLGLAHNASAPTLLPPIPIPACPRRYGFQSQRVAVWIYWHAVLLLAKGVPFFRCVLQMY